VPFTLYSSQFGYVLRTISVACCSSVSKEGVTPCLEAIAAPPA
jgi:hypothetical protein